MAARARYKRRRFQNRAGIAWASIVVLILVTVVSVKSVGLMRKAADLQAKEEYLKAQIEAEQLRSEEIADLPADEIFEGNEVEETESVDNTEDTKTEE